MSMADNSPNVIVRKEPITDDVTNTLIDRIFSNARLVLDLGAGHRRNARLGSFKDRLECPSFCMDLKFSTTLDVNGNLEDLPFKDNSIHTQSAGPSSNTSMNLRAVWSPYTGPSRPMGFYWSNCHFFTRSTGPRTK